MSIKVALACHNFPPEFMGGTERVVLALAHALQQRGDEVVVICGSECPHDGRDTIEEDGLGVRVIRIPRPLEESYGLEVVRPRLVEVFRDVLEREAVGVLHVHHWATLSIAMLRLAASIGISGGATLHDMWTSCGRYFRRPPSGIECPDGDLRDSCGPCAALDLEVPLWGLRKGIADRDREIRKELSQATFLTAPSHACWSLAQEQIPWEGPIEIVPHGLLEQVEDPGAMSPRSSAAPLRIGTFGNLVPDKGVMDLVEAMAGVEEAELHLSGTFLDPSFEAEVVQRAQTLGIRLVLGGPFDAAGGMHPARGLDLAVFPSRCVESYGLVVEEALARNVPVVVSDLGGLSERIGDGGVVVEAGDIGGLGRTLCELAADPERLASLRRGTPSQFSTIQNAAEKYAEMYRR
ncbi:MAG: glycosyltransferase [Planctomycetota bacterium]|jgi:glycosyltransferase involved in cell wall biosynthesis|nr:glycosyltransferase [Planctomycetota bacterium]